jgi:MFS family permease
MHLIPLGLVIGTYFGGYAQRFSRKYMFIILTFFGIVLNAISVVNNMPILFVSRALYGFLGGLFINLVPKIL